MTQVVVREPFETGSGTAMAGSTVDIDESLAHLMVTARKAAWVVPPRATPSQPQMTQSQIDALVAVAELYQHPPSTWYAGEINSVVTPAITADGDLTSATDQVPLKWLVVINADDDVVAAQALLDNGPNVIEVLLGAQAQPVVYADGSATPEVITRIYAVCVSSSAVPADYNGGAYIVSGSETDLADMLANMARFEFSAGLGATVARLVASPAYNTHYAQLSVAAGVVA